MRKQMMSSNIPEKGKSYEEILALLDQFGKDDPLYKEGKTWSLVYYLNKEYTEFLEAAYAKYFSANGLNPTAFKSLKRLEKEVEFVPTAWSAIFTGLSSNKYDCIISSLSITEERKLTIAYTRPYIANNQVIIVKSDNDDIKSEADLGDRIVAVQMGTTSEDSCNEFMKTTPFKDFKKYEGMIQALNELKIGRVDAVVTDLVVGKYFVANDKESFKLVSTTLPNEPIAIGFTKDNQAEADKIDKVLEEIMNDGTLTKISEKWFDEDMTKNLEQ
jgi:polar amino acid transport system substrate-binding protein